MRSSSHNPWRNLALEEHLLGRVDREEPILYLWQNENTVVIGRNQNAWRECNYRLLEQEGGQLARRLSGGGAVFHDLGNLNFTFITSRQSYDLHRQLTVVLRAVRAIGIEAEFSGRNDLVVGARKFSGNAFLLGNTTAYHHGTLLVNSDLGKLTRYLRVSSEKISSKGIESVRSRVVNLNELEPGLTVDIVSDALAESFSSSYSGERSMDGIDPDSQLELEDLYRKYESWEWRFGKSPQFDIHYDKRFTWGEVQLCLALKRGRIESVELYSDAMNADLILRMASALRQVPLRAIPITEALNDVATGLDDPDDRTIVEDIEEWLQGKQLP